MIVHKLLLFLGVAVVHCDPIHVSNSRTPATLSLMWNSRLSLGLRMPDGRQDEISLRPVDTPGGATCLFKGTLNNDVTGNVAVLGCRHSNKTQVTIISKYSNATMFNINKNNKTEIIPNPYVATIKEEEDIMALDEEADFHVLVKRSTYPILPPDYDEYPLSYSKEVLEPVPADLVYGVELAYDDTFLSKMNNNKEAAEQYILAVMAHTQTYLLHDTLGSRIHLHIQNKPKHLQGKQLKINDIQDGISPSMESAKKIPSQFALIIFIYSDDSDVWMGVSNRRFGCDPIGARAIIKWRCSIQKAAMTCAHEIAHLLGPYHDEREDKDKKLILDDCTGEGLMSDSVDIDDQKEQWSTCSKLRFQRWFNNFGKGCKGGQLKVGIACSDDSKSWKPPCLCGRSLCVKKHTSCESATDTCLGSEKSHFQGPWNVDHSFGGVTLQIKYKDPANLWKGGQAHFEVQDLQKLIPAARSRHVTFDVTFDASVAKRDVIFHLKIEYSLQHIFEEKGIFESYSKPIGNHWITAISNRRHGGGCGKRIFPEMEFHVETDHRTIFIVTYSNDRFKNMKLVIEPPKIGPESELKKRLTGDVDGQPLDLVFVEKRIYYISNMNNDVWRSNWQVLVLPTMASKFTGSLTLTYGSKINYQFSWVEDRNDCVKLDMIANTGTGDYVIKYSRTKNWNPIKLSVAKDGSNVVDAKFDETDIYGGQSYHFLGKVQRNKEVYYEYDSTISFGGNLYPVRQFKLDANSKMTVHSGSILHQLACNPLMTEFNFLCFNQRTMEAKFRADETKPYKMNVHTKIDHDGAEVFRVDMQTQTNPYKLTFNWPRMLAIVAPYINGPLEITVDHNLRNSLAITSNIRGFSQFSVVKMPNGQRKVTLNNKELFTADFWKSGRTITQSTTLPDGRALTTIFKWGNDNNWLNNHIELHLDGTEIKLNSKLEWNFVQNQGTWKLDAVGHNNRWGDYNIHWTGKNANNNGIWTFDIDGTALWKGNNVNTDASVKLDTSKFGNGKFDAITVKLIKIVDGKKYEVNVTDSKMAPGDFDKIEAFFRDISH